MSTTKTLDDYLKLSYAELILLKTQASWDVSTIEGQLMERGDEDEEWYHRAKTAAHYRRRDLAAINGAISYKTAQERSLWSDNDHGPPVLETLSKLRKLWEAAAAYIETEDESTERDQLLDELAERVHSAREVYFAAPLD